MVVNVVTLPLPVAERFRPYVEVALLLVGEAGCAFVDGGLLLAGPTLAAVERSRHRIYPALVDLHAQSRLRNARRAG